MRKLRTLEIFNDDAKDEQVFALKVKYQGQKSFYGKAVVKAYPAKIDIFDTKTGEVFTNMDSSTTKYELHSYDSQIMTAAIVDLNDGTKQLIIRMDIDPDYAVDDICVNTYMQYYKTVYAYSATTCIHIREFISQLVRDSGLCMQVPKMGVNDWRKLWSIAKKYDGKGSPVIGYDDMTNTLFPFAKFDIGTTIKTDINYIENK